MSANPKFTFETEFNAGGGERRTPDAERRRKKTLSVEEIETLQATAHAEGETRAAARTNYMVSALVIAVRATTSKALSSKSARAPRPIPSSGPSGITRARPSRKPITSP